MLTTIALTPDQRIDAQNQSDAPKINIPYWGQGPDNNYPDYTLLWFGQVSPTNNYADVRMAYTDEHLEVIFHIIDRRLWHDPNPTVPQLTNWDAVSLYLDMDGNVGQNPDANAHRFVVQLGANTAGDAYQTAYRGNGSSWVQATTDFTGWHGWRGEGFNNNNDDKGWTAFFVIPFSSLGLSSAPPKNSTWGLALTVHDRDDAGGTPIADQIWPESMNPQSPSTWGQLGFSIPYFSHPPGIPGGVTIVRQGLNGATVPDGHVGGHTTCGDGIDHWSEWGEANYAGYEQINIQNQWDVSDYPCFSKYFVTFPMNNVPPGKIILSATLTMSLFGNAGGGPWGEPPDSFIQVFSVGEAWNENTLTWNNAPLAKENFAGTFVHPASDGQSNVYHWDVSTAVTRAYSSGQPAHLALYSADGPMHTGKYFWSSNVGDWNASGRPTLEIVWGDVCGSGGIECHFTYLPIIRR
ncbi:MAG TPA: DNRLRE domain-containing protein [Chloroflexota bacterium]|nr:DNRLRE domain-containing protein [Chloroflexota bacterium]HUM71098.1 DNRLRE domain-containing protein [Chloroflexota bacterium]